MSRFHLVLQTLKRIEPPERSEELRDHCEAMLARHHRYVREHFEDMPEISEWTWPG
jgi:xylulose-5-phosphate/fructose-6-phosphate phosphoketolase